LRRGIVALFEGAWGRGLILMISTFY